MSLFQLIRRYLLGLLLVILILGCTSIYFIFKTFINQSADQVLYNYKDRIQSYINANDTLVLFKSSLNIPQRIRSEVIEDPQKYSEAIRDTLLYNEATGYFQPYRELSFTTRYKNKYHLVSINQPGIEMHDLVYVILGSFLAIFILFFLFTYLISYNLKRRIWAPFYKTLDILQTYDLERDLEHKIELEDSGIKEFDNLNHVVEKMVTRINRDYENVKEFSEDISHEMQTPLAIIKSKIELIKQKQGDTQEFFKTLSIISQSTTRLSKLNSSLLLLTKISNDQYVITDNINLAEVLSEYLNEFSELMEIKNITLVKQKIEDTQIELNANLSDILISNILNNAIRHNVDGGFISISLINKCLKVENSCDIVDKENIPDLFGRLTSLKTENTTGLGLSIVKSICDKNGIQVSYDFPKEDVFNINLRF